MFCSEGRTPRPDSWVEVCLLVGAEKAQVKPSKMTKMPEVPHADHGSSFFPSKTFLQRGRRNLPWGETLGVGEEALMPCQFSHEGFFLCVGRCLEARRYFPAMHGWGLSLRCCSILMMERSVQGPKLQFGAVHMLRFSSQGREVFKCRACLSVILSFS